MIAQVKILVLLLISLALVGALCILYLRRKLRSQAVAFGEAQRQLEVSRDQLRLALDGADEGLWDWDVKEHRTYYSERWSRMLGFSPEEIGSSVDAWERLVHPDDRLTAIRKLDIHMEGKSEAYQAEYRMQSKDGGWRWIQARGKVVTRSADGSPVRVAGTHLDITEQKKLAGALAKARDEALAASRSKSAFLANMSHEIRTPMNGIVGIAELLLITSLDEQQRRYAGIIRSSSEALLAILNDILDFSKIEAGQMQMECRPFDLHDLMRRTADLFVLTAASKKLAMSVEIADDVPSHVSGDAGRLRQVLTNLLGNAMKFTERGRVSIRCRRASNDPERVGIEFEISDTGLGIEPAVLDTLFRPFAQADESTTRRYGGTGLGLAICKQLVELMHGHIHATSVPGEGSTFRFIIELQPTLAAGTVENDLDNSLPRAETRRAHILVAEDNAINQKVIAHLLEHLRHSVEIVTNGREAIMAAESRSFDIILMDCQMPEMGGYEAARLIRQGTGPGRRTPIIALTANALSTDRERCIEAGMDDYVSKPVKLDTLTKVLDKWLVEPSPGNGRPRTRNDIPLREPYEYASGSAESLPVSDEATRRERRSSSTKRRADIPTRLPTAHREKPPYRGDRSGSEEAPVPSPPD